MEKDKNSKYTKLNPREHVLLKPSMYLGDTSIREEENYVFQDGKIIKRKINWSPALYKIYDEIIVNAYDQVIRDNSLRNIKIKIDRKFIQVTNDGMGIDIFIHKIYKIYIPELIFGNLMTSTNFQEGENRITGGTHGLGAKLTNIFSKKFEIIVKDTKTHLEYRQSFHDNLTIIDKPIIKKYDGKNGEVSIKFYPDFKRFGMTELDQDHIDLFTKRAYDLTGLTDKNIYLNDSKLNVSGWDQYTKLYEEDFFAYHCNKHWELSFKLDSNAYQLSFVNGIFTNKNGKHMEYIIEQITEKLSKQLKDISKKWIRNNFTIILKTSIVNPSFNSQTKEELMTPVSKFGISCELDNKFFKMIDIEQIKEMLKSSRMDAFSKSDGNKKSTVKGIPKLEDANYAGTKKSSECTLILTEGDSAKATAISGISVIKGGRNIFGVFPLKGKLLNVREASMAQISKNNEINNLKKIMGFKSGITYTKENISQLRYGSIMLMMDADEDGSHIKGLVINFLNYFYPSLLRLDKFLKVIMTPVVKATYKDIILKFNNLSAYNVWKNKSENNPDKYKIKYYKGLGTSTAKEAGEYFDKLPNHLHFLKSLVLVNPHPSLELAFNKKLADNRKDWLRTYDMNKRIDFQPEMIVNIKEFIELELKHFSNYDNIRSLPSVIDGFKPSQRKVIYACFKRNLKEEMKVAQLGGYVGEHTAYHHGEASLLATIINLAQDFVGSNNINLLEPVGQFGSRLLGGKDHSSARYIFTQLSSIIRYIIRKEDNGILEYMDDDGQKIEPKIYYPIVPLVLINGADGIGTGFSTFIPNYNIHDVIAIIMDKLNNAKPNKIEPYYKNYTGSLKKVDSETFLSKGIIKLEDSKLFITELPLKTWTTKYKIFLEEMIFGGSDLFSNYSNQSSDVKVLFILKLKDVDKVKQMMNKVGDMGITELEKHLKLYDTFKITNMHGFNVDSTIKKYSSPNKIIDEYFTVRLEKYSDRKKLLLSQLKAELDLDENKLRWLSMILNNQIDLRKMKNDETIAMLSKKKFTKKDNTYDYLLNIPIKDMTRDQMDKLKGKIKNLIESIKKLEKKTPTDMWKDDLEELKTQLKKIHV